MKKMRTKIYLLIMPVLFLSVIREDIKKSMLNHKFICTLKTNKTQYGHDEQDLETKIINNLLEVQLSLEYR